MLSVDEAILDKITEALHRILNGKTPAPVALPEGHPDDEVRQVATYTNRFLVEYSRLAEAMDALSRGSVELDVPKSRMSVLQSFKNLNANLRHLTWKTQQIAAGDLTQHIDFMGDFSIAFNSMTQQLHDAFAKIEEQSAALRKANEQMTQDLEAAGRLQQSLLPRSAPDIPGVHSAWHYRPCDELAGDILNVFPLDAGHMGVYLADVSGHGVAASLLSVAISHVLNPSASQSSVVLRHHDDGTGLHTAGPAEVVRELNRRFQMDESDGKYFTILYGVLDLNTRVLTYVTAGHSAIICQTPEGAPRSIESPGMPVGFFPHTEYEEVVCVLAPGERIYIYSDGIPEAMNADEEQYGDQRLMNALAAGRARSLEACLSAVVEDVLRWCGAGGPQDDVSLLAIELD
jgi:serine phosphatase RsbU (regulator of sigma subunit)